MTTPFPVWEIVQWFANGDLAIPEIQRDVVWKPSQVKDLIASVFRYYPCGSFIFWEPLLPREATLIKSMIRPERLEMLDGKLPKYFLLDGQQRITALATAFLPHHELEKVLAEVSDDMPHIFCNLKEFAEFDFEATTGPSGKAFPWVSLQATISGDLLQGEEIRHKLGEKTLKAINEAIGRFKGYQFPVQIVQERKYAEAARIFQLVNSQGTPLTGAEIHLARLVPYWPGITKQFRDYRHELKDRKYDLDLSSLMRAITAIECDSAHIARLTQQLANSELDKAGLRRQLQRAWRQSRRAIDRVVKTLSTQFNLDRSRYFPSKNVLIPLVYYAAREKTKTVATKQMLRFFLGSQLSERYGGSAETVFRRDFRVLTDQNHTARQNLEELADAVMSNARDYYKRLRIKPDDVSGPPAKNVLLLLMYILMREKGATDWGEWRDTLLRDIEPAEMQIHHVFPFNFMMNDKDALAYRDRKELNPRDYRAEVNDIANMTFISKKENGLILDSPPWQYLPQETSKEIRAQHHIPEDQELWHPSRFGDFLQGRRQLIAKAATRLLKRFR
jgi:hypothetical protein